jgi:hypothetical protein
MNRGRAARSIVLVGAMAAGTLLAGCTSYYKVSDPGTGRAYYTTNVKSERGGAVKFTDMHGAGTVTMQNSVVLKVTEAEAMNPPANAPAASPGGAKPAAGGDGN